MDCFHTVIITGIHVKKLSSDDSKEHEAISIENVERSEEAFKVPVRIEEDASEQPVGYEFSLVDILEQNNCELQDGLLFQCQVITNGLSKLHSIPKPFAEFILLGPPANLEVTTPVEGAGLHIDWEYCAHAIGYRVELVHQEGSTTEITFSKILKCETGSHGKAIFYKNDIKDIPYTSYQLQMYSLGLGQDLIRCLKPTVASGIIHVIPAKLEYLDNSNAVRVKFKPITKGKYIVELCRVTGNDVNKPNHLTANEVCGKAVTDFPLKKFQPSLQSGDLVVAWVYSTHVTTDCDITYIGAPQEEVHILDPPKLETSFVFCSDGTLSGTRLTWSDISKAQGYQYGLLSDKNEYITLMETTQERESFINFTECSFEQLARNGSCQFQMYVSALGKPEAFLVGALSLDATRLQCITTSHSLEDNGAVVFTSITLQQLWRKHLTDFAFSHYYSFVISPQFLLFPSGKVFPSINIPKKFKEKFWKNEAPFFGNGKSHAVMENCARMA